MPDRPVAVYDANVLYPAQLRDLLMRLAIGGVVRAHWTERIHDEWMRNVHADHPDLSWEDLERLRGLMDEALPDACITGFESRIDDVSLPDPEGRHVLAAAIHIEADCILTFNTRDFPPSELDAHGIESIDPDRFVTDRFENRPEAVIEVAAEHRASLTQPPKTPSEYLDLLRKSRLKETVRRLKRHRGRL